MKAVAYDATVDQWITEDGSRVNGSDAATGKVKLELPASVPRGVAHDHSFRHYRSSDNAFVCDCGKAKGYADLSVADSETAFGDNDAKLRASHPVFANSAYRTTAQISAQERSKLTDAIIAQVGELTRQGNVLMAAQNRTNEWKLAANRDFADAFKRIDAIDRRAAILNTSFMARLRWLLTGG